MPNNKSKNFTKTKVDILIPKTISKMSKHKLKNIYITKKGPLMFQKFKNISNKYM